MQGGIGDYPSMGWRNEADDIGEKDLHSKAGQADSVSRLYLSQA